MITSVQNALIKHIVALRESKERRASGLSLVDGLREIERAINTGVKVKHVVFCQKLLSLREEKTLLAKAVQQKIETIEVDERVFTKVAFGERAEGLLAVIETPQRKLEELRLSKTPLIVVLESVEKPGNLGAMLRSCDGAGVDAVLVSDAKTDIYNPNVIRASTGIVFSLPVIAESRDRILKFLKEHQIHTFATAPDAVKNYTQANLKSAAAIILGTEDKGLSDAWLNQADYKIKIPMLGSADSLNVSVACALLVYEALRQRT